MPFGIRLRGRRLCHGSTAAVLPQPVEADVAEYLPDPGRESGRLLQSLELAERLQECVLESILGLLLAAQVTLRLQVEAVLMTHHQGFEGIKAAGKGGGYQLGICGWAFHRSLHLRTFTTRRGNARIFDLLEF